jgi:hypothetical protein
VEIIENKDQFPGTEVGVEDRFTIGSDNGCESPRRRIRANISFLGATYMSG